MDFLVVRVHELLCENFRKIIIFSVHSGLEISITNKRPFTA